MVKSCASPAGMRNVCAAGSLNWSILSANTVSICLLSETFLNPGEAIRLANYICHRRQTQQPGAARPGAVLKTVILFVAEYDSTP